MTGTDEAWAALDRLRREGSTAQLQPEYQSPRALVDFVSDFAALAKPKSILDPMCGLGVMLAASANAADAESAHGVEINSEISRLASETVGESLMLVNRNCFFSDAEILSEYDFIVADPPGGARLGEMEAESLGLKETGSFSLDHGLVLWAALRLSDDGVGLVVVTPSFFFNKQAKRVHEAVASAGARIAAAVHIPKGISQDLTIGRYLVLVERGQQEDLFVAQLNSEADHRNQLLSNLRTREAKGAPSLGRLCALDEFSGFESLEAQEALARLARDLRWTGHRGESVFTNSERLREDAQNKLSEDSNSVYLKLVGGRASTRLEELSTGKASQLKEVLHLKVDPALANPAFMAHWFNDTRVGQLSFTSLSNTQFRPRIRPQELLQSVIHLPPIEDQALILEGAAYLGRVRAEVAELEDQLWAGSQPVGDTVDRIRSINQEDTYEDWFETLPFPLARVLWKHHASNRSYRERYETLLHFFEATAAFLATVHLSAFMSEDEVWAEYGPQLIKTLEKEKLSLRHATFGSWKLTFEFLSKRCGDMLTKQGPDGEKPTWQRIFGTSDRRAVQMLADARLRTVLQEANKIRNDWHGHSGAIGGPVAKDVHDQLESLVQRTREAFGQRWRSYELIQPDSSRKKSGIHYVTSNRLVGTRCNPFEERVYESEESLESGALYLFDPIARQGLQLLPLVTVMPSPEQAADTCYVLSRVGDKDGPRWVSYHYEPESQINQYVEGVSETFERLEFREPRLTDG